MALGAGIGATPILFVHTWAAAGLALLFRLPPAAAVLASNLSNPLTFWGITYLEIRIGYWLLGNNFELSRESLSRQALAEHIGAAWLGFVPVSLLMIVVSYGVMWLLLVRRGQNRSGQAGSDGGRTPAQRRAAKGSASE